MKFLPVLFVAVAFFATGEALQCYQCAWPQAGCEDPFDDSASAVTKMTCVGIQNTCTKVVVEVSNGTTAVQRTCSVDPLNYRRSFDRASVTLVSTTVHYCDSNLCNGVSTTSAALSMLTVLALPFVFRNHH